MPMAAASKACKFREESSDRLCCLGSRLRGFRRQAFRGQGEYRHAHRPAPAHAKSPFWGQWLRHSVGKSRSAGQSGTDMAEPLIQSPRRPTRWRRGGAAPGSSQRVGGTRVFEAGGDAKKRSRSLAILRSGVRRRALQPALEVFRRQFLPRREHSSSLWRSRPRQRNRSRVLGAAEIISGLSLSARDAQPMPSAYCFAPKLAKASMCRSSWLRASRGFRRKI